MAEDHSTQHELAELSASLRAVAEYHRAMGLAELLRERAAGRVEAGEAEDAPPRAGPGPALLVDPAEALDELERFLDGCTRCPLHEGRHHIVYGAGDPRARLAFVGEGPGRDEDLQGVPFVGPAGQLLTKIIKAIGLERDQVYICNVVKCRPPKNRNPRPEEQAACGPFLERQLEIVAPEVIVALGAVAAGYLLETERPVGRLRGRFHHRGNALVMATYHPAYLLRTPSAKRDVWEDMKLVRDRLGLPS